MAADRNARSRMNAAQNGIQPKADETFVGFVEFEAGMVRSHLTQGVRSFCIMDSAKDGDRMHSDITINRRGTKPERSKLRNELRKLILDLKPRLPDLPGGT